MSAVPEPRAQVLRGICIAIMVLATLEFMIATTGVQIANLPRSTDFATYYLAGAQTRDGLSPYDTDAIAARGYALGFEHEQFPFLYPPPFALAMQPLARLPYPRARQVWMLVATAALLAALAVTVQLVRRQAQLVGIENPSWTWTLLAAFFPAALNSTGVHNDIRAGSVGILLYLALAVVAWALVSERRGWAGVALALATLLKLTPAVLIPYAVWRRFGRAALLAIVLLVVVMVPAVLHWGWRIVPEYVDPTLVGALAKEYPRPMNQSLDAALSRLLVPSPLVTSPFDLPGLKRILGLLLPLSVALATWLGLRPRRRHVALLPVELGAVVLGLLLIMKITWVHTLTAMLFVWPCLMIPILRAAERGARWARTVGVWACLGFLLSSAHIPILWRGLREGLAVVAISVHVAGLLVLWLVALGVLHHERDCV